ncbi:MAG TPA: hypothetical protein IAB48_09115 [Candidatus Fimimorpha excrementavium]|nr:hypothetical protein [Candidatus Fimimorpha excrementavium]
MGIVTRDWEGKQEYTLTKGALSLTVCPEDGMNMHSIVFEGHTVVEIQEDRRQAGKLYAVPILYPTPNRIRNNEWTLGDQTCPAVMHGIARYMEFQTEKVEETEEACRIMAVCQWDEKQERFPLFPYVSQMRITMENDGREIRFSYEITDLDHKVLPYGLALHPFFASDRKEEIRVYAEDVMEMTEDKLPTGRLLPVSATEYDLRTGRRVTELDLDHVYTSMGENPKAEILYPEFKLTLNASDEFGHMVVFTPDAPFFCLENQTCSTDAHNMYQNGFQKESGLIQILPGESQKGWVAFQFEHRNP